MEQDELRRSREGWRYHRCIVCKAILRGCCPKHLDPYIAEHYCKHKIMLGVTG